MGESYSPISSEEPHSRSSSSLGFGQSGHFDFTPADHHSPFRYTAPGHDDAPVYTTSPALMSFAGSMLDSEREIQAGLEFTYPLPVGVDILQEEGLKQGFYDLELNRT
jgi:hypothetical protein